MSCNMIRSVNSSLSQRGDCYMVETMLVNAVDHTLFSGQHCRPYLFLPDRSMTIGPVVFPALFFSRASQPCQINHLTQNAEGLIAIAAATGVSSRS